MNTDKLKQLCANRLATLETRLADLLAYCEQLRLENQSLRAREIELLAERDGSIQQKEQAHPDRGHGHASEQPGEFR